MSPSPVRRAREALIPLLILLPVAWALLPGGLPNTADGTVHFMRAAEWVHAWQDGVWLPRWSQHLGYGYGIPLFVYAPPLPYLLTATLHGLGLPPEAAYKGMLLTAIGLAGVGAYRLGRSLLGVWAGAVSAAAFVYAPILLRELFIQGNAAQLLAWACGPWAAWAVIESYRTPRLRYAVALALALTGTLLSHNAAALLVMGMVVGLALVLWLTTGSSRGLALSAAGSALGLILAAWFWVPALLEGRYVALDRIVASDFRPRFIELAELLAWPPRLDTGAINPYLPLTLGAAQVGIAVLGVLGWLVLALRLGDPQGYMPWATPDAAEWTTLSGSDPRAHKPWATERTTAVAPRLQRGGHGTVIPSIARNPSGVEERREIPRQAPRNDSDLPPTQRRLLWGAGLFMTLFAAFCGFMATRGSEPVWTLLPFVDLFEWPFRWHGLTALGLSWLAAAAVAGGASLAPCRQRPAAATVLGGTALAVLLAAALVQLYPQKLLPGTRRISPAEVVRYEVKSSTVGSTSLGEFNPIWVEQPLHTSPLVEAYRAGEPVNRLPQPLPSGVSGLPLETTAHRHSFRVQVSAPTTLTLSLLYFPGWQAAADGATLILAPHPGNGLIDVGLPAGDYTLALTFRETPLRAAADLVSAAAWVGLAAAGVLWAWRSRRLPLKAASLELQPSGETSVAPRLQRGVLSGEGGAQGYKPWATGEGWPVLAVAGVVAGVLALQVGLPQAFQRHSPPDTAGPAQVTLHADFGDVLRLLGVDPPPAVVSPGAPLTLVAYWRALQPLEDDYAVFLHLDDPVTGATLAAVDQSHPSDIPTSGWATGLYVRNPLRLVVPADALPIQYALRVGVYDRSGELVEAAGSASGLVEVGRVWVKAQPAPQPPAGPTARFDDGTVQIELLGAEVDPAAGTLTLYWRTDAPPSVPYSIFVHLLDADGQMLAQADGAPYANRYPLPAWRPESVVEDRRDLAATGVDLARVQRIAVGIYDPTTGVRLAAIDGDGQPLPDDRLLLDWPARK